MLACGALADGALATPLEEQTLAAGITVELSFGGKVTLPQAQDSWLSVADIEIETTFAMIEIEATTA